MKFTETKIRGVFIIDPERFGDDRGFVAPAFSAREFAERGMASQIAETNISYSLKRGTLRGLHFQKAPHGQAKLVRCTRGAVYDVAVDLRPDSPTHKEWVGVELTAENRRMIYLPGDCAHGFQTLADDTEVFYMVSSHYAPDSSDGYRWNDPAFRTEWPDAGGERIIIKRDREYPDYGL